MIEKWQINQSNSYVSVKNNSNQNQILLVAKFHTKHLKFG